MREAGFTLTIAEVLATLVNIFRRQGRVDTMPKRVWHRIEILNQRAVARRPSPKLNWTQKGLHMWP